MKTRMLTAEYLREILYYNPETGAFTWKIRKGSKALSGSAAGSFGYRYVHMCVDRGRYYGHRLAWLYMTGSWPEKEVDHINGNGFDNRWSNLREASHKENHQNKIACRTNKVGALGVSICRKTGKYRAYIGIDGQTYALGTYASAEEASAAYQKAKAELHLFNPTVRGSKNVSRLTSAQHHGSRTDCGQGV